jgi:hypothetical protein
MARKVENVTIAKEGRDLGKVFQLTEMSAVAAEKWAARALSAVGRSNLNVPDDVSSMGMAAIAMIGIQALASVQFADAEPLMDEMMGCVQIAPSAGIVRPLFEGDIEEVATLATLRGALIELHTGFSIAGTLSKLRGAAAKPSSELTTPTSPELSA